MTTDFSAPAVSAADGAASSRQDTAPAFRVVDGSVEYDRKPVLHGVSLEIARGETLAIMGANGSGKSTLLRALLGIVPLSEGGIEIHGTPLRLFRDWSRVGYVPQRLSAGGGVPATVREIVTSGRVARHRRLWLPWSARSAADRAAVEEALATVGLTDRARDSVHELSGGQQQRVLIARALAGQPDTFVMDEPMAGVDAASQRALARALDALARTGHTIVLVLHEPGMLAPLIQRAVVLDGGRVAHDGPPPAPVGECARPGHDHIHPHAGERRSTPVLPPLGGFSGA